MNVKDYLLQLGYEEADAATLAGDQKMSRAIEAAAKQYEEGNRVKAEAEKQTKELNDWWTNTAQPSLLNADSDGAKAKAESARLRTYMESMKAKGYPVDDEFLGSSGVKEEPKVTQNQPTFDPRAAALEMAQATARLYDLGSEYRELYGSDLPGAYNLLEEAQRNNKPVTDYVKSKFNFEGKRAEINAKKEADRVASITKDITDKLEAKYAERANPMLAPAITSKAAAIVEAQGDNADSWRTKQGRNDAKKDRLLQFRNVLKTA